VTKEITYLAADEEEEHVIAQASAALDDNGRLTEEKVLVRRGPQGTGVRVGAATTSYGTTSEIDFVPRPSRPDGRVAEADRLGVHGTDPLRRARRRQPGPDGANMQKQAVPLVVPEAPYIGTGVEARAARDAGDVVLAEADGTVVDVSGDQIVVEYKAGAKDRNGSVAGQEDLSVGQVPPVQPEHRHNQKVIVEEASSLRRRCAGRRPGHPQRRAGPGQEPPGRLHALGGLQLRDATSSPSAW